jgi:hypothetical protein
MNRPAPDPSVPDKAANIGRREDCCAEGSPHDIEPKTRRGGRILAFGSVSLAFLASQHHTIMMLLLTFGFSDAAMHFMTAAPVARNVMLGMSLAMIAVIAWQIRDSRRPASTRIMGALSVVATLGLSVWSIAHFGL